MVVRATPDFRTPSTRLSSTREMWRDLDVFIAFNNEQRTLKGYCLKGRKSTKAMREALGVDRLRSFSPPANQP